MINMINFDTPDYGCIPTSTSSEELWEKAEAIMAAAPEIPTQTENFWPDIIIPTR